jgi:hypothetical protein
MVAERMQDIRHRTRPLSKIRRRDCRYFPAVRRSGMAAKIFRAGVTPGHAPLVLRSEATKEPTMTVRLDPLAAAPSLMKEWQHASLAISVSLYQEIAEHIEILS